VQYKDYQSYKSFIKSPYRSFKNTSYFQVYDDLFGKYRDKPITFVEVGVFHGGSLFMWRDYFGDDARIIGIDLNPAAKKWKEHNFEIFIGDQSDPNFWESFFKQVGPIDILLDDGGHTFEQQIATVHNSLKNINNQGLIVVEDTHTSYMKEFGFPSKFTFVQWAKNIIDHANKRFDGIKGTSSEYNDYIYSINFFESIVCFNIDRTKCYSSTVINNGGLRESVTDFRYKDTGLDKIDLLFSKKGLIFSFFSKFVALKRFKLIFIRELHAIVAHYRLIKLKKYFK